MDSLEDIDRRIDALVNQIKKLEPVANKPDELGPHFHTGPGVMSVKQAKRRQEANNRRARAFRELREAQRELAALEKRRPLVVAGELHPNGQPRADAPSRKRQESAVGLYITYFRERVKPGSRVELFARGDGAMVTVARLNKSTVTTTGGTKWRYEDLRPLQDGRCMTNEEFKADLAAWIEKREASHVIS